MYQIRDVHGNILFSQKFADKNSALGFALLYLPETVDFKISEVIETRKDCDVVDLQLFKERKYGNQKASNQ